MPTATITPRAQLGGSRRAQIDEIGAHGRQFSRSPGATSRRDAQRGNNDWIRGQVSIGPARPAGLRTAASAPADSTNSGMIIVSGNSLQLQRVVAVVVRMIVLRMIVVSVAGMRDAILLGPAARRRRTS